MKRGSTAVSLERIEKVIHMIRGQRIILDSDLAKIYSVSTKALNQAVKRNAERFPDDFMFRVAAGERDEISFQTANTANRSQVVTGLLKATGLQSQFVTSKGRGGRRNLPYAFTEHGAIMAANVLNSPRAIEMSVFVVRAFVRMRGTMANSRALAELERDLKERLDVHELAIVDILRRFMEIIDPPPLPEPPRKQIGFRAKGSNGKDKKSKDKR